MNRLEHLGDSRRPPFAPLLMLAIILEKKELHYDHLSVTFRRLANICSCRHREEEKLGGREEHWDREEGEKEDSACMEIRYIEKL